MACGMCEAHINEAVRNAFRVKKGDKSGVSEGKHSDLGAVLFAAGFTVMMALDVALG